NKRFFIQPLCDGFLDLATALPFPPSVPAYSATIILVAVTSRLALFPIALWGRNRVRRLENVVLPEVERLKPIISKQVLDEMKQQKMPKEMLVPATLQRMHLSRMIEKVKSEQKRLIAEHKCSPIPSMVVSPLSQLPVFVILTTVFNRLAQDPTPFDSEAFLTLTTLNHPDPTWTLPIILGMVTMANVESNNWLMSAVQRDRLRKVEERRASQIAAGVSPGIQPHRIIKSSLNVLSVIRIVFAALSPGSVVLYWTTSAICGLVQTWILDY
ncbi:membrane insertase OXA1/ALB3/YidC, partial [Mycena vitilis]